LSGGERLEWPVRLSHGLVELRALRYRDARTWLELRERNADWLREWEPTTPPPGGRASLSFRQMVRRYAAGARAGEALPWAVMYDGTLAGQLSVSNVVWGSARMATAGYWIDQRLAGKGITPTALALAVDHCFFSAGIHRIEVNIRPENHASLRVVRKLGFREEGVRERFLHINGEWRDHLSFALTADDVPNGLLRRWTESRHLAGN
jgi:ribosomal-protein-alanine N-acetyltransferase